MPVFPATPRQSNAAQPPTRGVVRFAGRLLGNNIRGSDWDREVGLSTRRKRHNTWPLKRGKLKQPDKQEPAGSSVQTDQHTNQLISRAATNAPRYATTL